MVLGWVGAWAGVFGRFFAPYVLCDGVGCFSRAKGFGILCGML